MCTLVNDPFRAEAFPLRCDLCVDRPALERVLQAGGFIGHLAHLPQGQPERQRRVLNMVAAMDREGFGNCRNDYECEAVCPKEISVRFIAEMNRDYRSAAATGREG